MVGDDAHGGLQRVLCEEAEVAEGVVVAEACGAEDGDVGGAEREAVMEGFGEVVGFLLGDMDETVGEARFDVGRE